MKKKKPRRLYNDKKLFSRNDMFRFARYLGKKTPDIIEQFAYWFNGTGTDREGKDPVIWLNRSSNGRERW